MGLLALAPLAASPGWLAGLRAHFGQQPALPKLQRGYLQRAQTQHLYAKQATAELGGLGYGIKEGVIDARGYVMSELETYVHVLTPR